MDAKYRCKSCDFFRKESQTCHRLSPANSIVRWVKVGEADWCGEHSEYPRNKRYLFVQSCSGKDIGDTTVKDLGGSHV